MKYIDAEKLKAFAQKGYDSAKESEEYDDDMYETGRADAYEDIIHIIDFLQQEQPEVDLEMVVRIDYIVMTMLAEGYNSGFRTRPFYEEVLRRLNVRKEENK